MIVPSIDLMNGNAVQLVGGKMLEIDAGDPRPLARKFGLVGEIAVIDLDAARGHGSNAPVIEELLRLAPCRVGGGIRDAKTAIRWLDAGAHKVILGTAAEPDVLKHLPPDRVIAALDAVDDDVVVEGWTKRTGRSVLDRIDELKPYVGGFLVTFVEREGRRTGLPTERIEELARAASPARLTVAGGVREPADICIADQLNADAQVGMALYRGDFDLADALAGCLITDRDDGLWPTIVCDEHDRVLGLAYSNVESLRAALDTGQGVYHSRSRDELWHKGKTSGNTQQLLAITTDCDRDTLRFRVMQSGDGFCHLNTATCFGHASGLAKLDETIRDRVRNAPARSYTRRLFDDAELQKSKLVEEAHELIDAADPEHAAEEAADVLYFALVAAAARGVSLADIERVLDRRTLRVSRRKGDAKPAPDASNRPKSTS